MPERSGPERPRPEPAVRQPPYPTELKPYGRALVDLARRRDEILCLSGDLTRQCEVDLFQAEIPDRFIHAGMAEANMMSMAGALAQAAAHAGQPSVLVCRTSTVHGLDCLPPDADGHFIKLPPELAAAAVAELTGKLEALRA